MDRHKDKVVCAQIERERARLAPIALAAYNALSSSARPVEIVEAVRKCRLYGVETPQMLRRFRVAYEEMMYSD